MAKFSDIQLVSTDEELASVDMSEFFGEGCVVYARKVRAIDHIKVGKDPKAKGWPENGNLYGVAKLLTMVCQDKDGEPFFDQPVKDIPRLLKMPMDVISRLSVLAGAEIDFGDDLDEGSGKN